MHYLKIILTFILYDLIGVTYYDRYNSNPVDEMMWTRPKP